MKKLAASLVLVALVAASPLQADGRERSGGPANNAAAQLASANDAARRRPVAAQFQGARAIYPFENGSLYQVYANPAYVSTILLEPGESLESVAAGDTSRWMVTQSQGGSQGETRAIVLIKPRAAGLRTNLVFITDRRTYLIEVVSQAGVAYSAETAWSYPASPLQSADPPAFDRLNFDYRIRTVRGPTPIWSPQRVFDDGRRTWIEFSPQVEASDMPPLFVVTAEGAELVNYRVQGGRYMVDRIFSVGELRLGARAQTIVRIERNPARPSRPRVRRGLHP